ncbi:helical backbone metal receptor [Aliifodinibius sp. S!AR15-10]|uniref:helical backbone metal receptor n=1 Tax=Aliifodinibius sp. S!AR15-10 TaxID=2950437 RepID=UPI00285A851B|nr:helical backbone metal receptor [Aliifodinibius sp. S!AR15-10]MDR8390661.1 helical backbone metal receptor [Aliifodinibius sp. S!AR15-10]
MASYQRIISLVPSLTELLIYLGLKENLVGRTRFCIHPQEDIADIPIIGGTKNPRIDKIKKAAPDFILANKEENRKEDIEELEQDFHVHLTDITTIEDALISMHELGKSFGKTEQSDELAGKISDLLEQRPDEPPIRAAYLIWRDPWMTIGSDTYINDVMGHWKLDNVFDDQQRYPKITLQSIKQRDPELVLLSSEPYPFKEKHVEEVQKKLPNTRILPVEGEWFSWYGSRMLEAFEKLNVWRKAIA